jgi:hypothetical protein
MAVENFLRYASKSACREFILHTTDQLGPNERRTISREDLGLYHALIIGAVYEFTTDASCVDTLNALYCPVKCCIDGHPYMSVVVEDMDTDKSFFRRAPTIDLEQHINILGCYDDKNDSSRIEQLLAANLDVPFPAGIPPWRILVLPLQRGHFVAFCYSHMIGDGLTGRAFHRTLLEALKKDPDIPKSETYTIETPDRPLPAPFDTAERLPISWTFLLSPLLSLVLPASVANYTGLRTSGSTIDAGTWTGSEIPEAGDLNPFHSKVKLREVRASTFAQLLRTVKAHDTKLTGVFEEAVVRALIKALPDLNTTNFVSQTAINMRASVGAPDDEGGEFASACYIIHPRRDPTAPFSEAHWAASRASSRKLAQSASTLQDQAISLLRYLPSIRKWTTGKFGQRRDCSFEVSNIGAFADREPRAPNACGVRVTRMVFAQPGQIISAPMAFNLVSVAGGALAYTVSWQTGALGDVGVEEEVFIERICAAIECDLEALTLAT